MSDTDTILESMRASWLAKYGLTLKGGALFDEKGEVVGRIECESYELDKYNLTVRLSVGVQTIECEVKI